MSLNEDQHLIQALATTGSALNYYSMGIPKSDLCVRLGGDTTKKAKAALKGGFLNH
jgi:hypothetical protein